jgi:hypothetical protein
MPTGDYEVKKVGSLVDSGVLIVDSGQSPLSRGLPIGNYKLKPDDGLYNEELGMFCPTLPNLPLCPIGIYVSFLFGINEKKQRFLALKESNVIRRKTVSRTAFLIGSMYLEKKIESILKENPDELTEFNKYDTSVFLSIFGTLLTGNKYEKNRYNLISQAIKENMIT